MSPTPRLPMSCGLCLAASLLLGCAADRALPRGNAASVRRSGAAGPLLGSPQAADREARVPSAGAPAEELPSRAQEKRDSRRALLLRDLGDREDPLSELYESDDHQGPLSAARAIEAFAEEENLKAVLYAQAAVGADPGNRARRELLEALETRTAIPADRDRILPLRALVHAEMRAVEAAFFQERYGDALQACRRVLLLTPEDPRAWERLGSVHYALDDEPRARKAYEHALSLDPENNDLRAFLLQRGWR